MCELGSILAQNKSITTLSITPNNYGHCDMSKDWMDQLGSGLAQDMSINTLSITVNDYFDIRESTMSELESSLAQNTSITTLRITVNNCSDMSEHWMGGLGRGLAKHVDNHVEYYIQQLHCHKGTLDGLTGKLFCTKNLNNHAKYHNEQQQ